jgi:hypothetical protein
MNGHGSTMSIHFYIARLYQQVSEGDTLRGVALTLFLFGFEVTPGKITCVTDVPEPIDPGRIGTGRSPFIREIDTIDR